MHPEGIYDDPKGGLLRENVYQRLRYHFQFQNELMLFSIGHSAKFSLNVYGPETKIGFVNLTNLFHPKTIDACFIHDGEGAVGGIKTEENKWNINGHLDRLIKVGEQELDLFATLYDELGTPASQARLPALHSQKLKNVVAKFASSEKRLADLEGEFLLLKFGEKHLHKKRELLNVKQNSQKILVN